MSQGNSKMARPSTDCEEITNHNNLHNQNLIRFEKTKKNRIVKKYGKLLEQLSKQKLSFSSLDNEIKFLNQIYFLHQKIQDLEDCLQETTDMLVEFKDTKKINKSFRQEIKIDNQKQNMIRNLATLVFLSQEENL